MTKYPSKIPFGVGGVGPMKSQFLVFFVGQHFPIGVAETSADLALRLLVRQSHRLDVATTGPIGSFDDGVPSDVESFEAFGGGGEDEERRRGNALSQRQRVETRRTSHQ